jgi:ABC-2 type transport system permease protein
VTTGNSELQLLQGSGWSRGLGNHLRGELARWFGSRKWWTQILIFALAVNLILALMIWDKPDVDDPYEHLCMFSNAWLGIAASVGVLILMQGAIVGEKQSGAAAWVLSKPISRAAFYLAKLIANAIGTYTTIILAQGLIIYLLIYVGFDTAPAPLAFLVGLGIHAVHLLFYLTLALMLGAIFDRRGPVIAIPIVPMLFDEIIISLAPPSLYDILIQILPWGLTTGFNDEAQPIAGSIMLGQQPYSLGPIFWTVGFSLLFVVIGIRVFQRQEF